MSSLLIRPHFGNAAGLCNQLTFLINALLFASSNQIDNVIVDNFITDLSTRTFCPFSQIIQMDETNEYLRKYNVVLKDINYVNPPIDPQNAAAEFAKNISQTSISDSWIDSSKFFDIYNNIVFTPNFYKLSNNLIPEIKQKLGDDIKINIIHLRVEDDAIIHWANINKTRPDVFKKVLEAKYIYLINKYINKYAFTIVMTYNKNNNVIQYLKNNGYYFFTQKKDPGFGRERNAILDLILAQRANNFFIGAAGSTFSHFINNTARDLKKTILIDIDNIYKPASVHNK